MGKVVRVRTIFNVTGIGSVLAFALTLVWTKLMVYSDADLNHVFSLFVTASLLSTLLHFGGHYFVFQEGLGEKRLKLYLIVLGVVTLGLFLRINIDSNLLALPLGTLFVLKLYAESIYLRDNRANLFLFSMLLEPLLRFALLFSGGTQAWIYIIAALSVFYTISILKSYSNKQKSKRINIYHFLGLWLSELLGLGLIKGDQYLSFQILSEEGAVHYYLVLSLLGVPLKLLGLLGRGQLLSEMAPESSDKLFTRLRFFSISIGLLFAVVLFYLWTDVFSIFFNKDIAESTKDYKWISLMVPFMALVQVLSVKTTVINPKFTNVVKLGAVLILAIGALLLVKSVLHMFYLSISLTLIQFIGFTIIIRRNEKNCNSN